jgi:hypothetical protein
VKENEEGLYKFNGYFWGEVFFGIFTGRVRDCVVKYVGYFLMKNSC